MRQYAYNDCMAKKNQYDLARLFVALGNETRLHLLHLIGDREVCVCELVDALKQPQPKVSQHLAFLRNAGIVEARREGKWMHYRITHPAHDGARKILQTLQESLKNDLSMSSVKTTRSSKCCT